MKKTITLIIILIILITTSVIFIFLIKNKKNAISYKEANKNSAEVKNKEKCNDYSDERIKKIKQSLIENMLDFQAITAGECVEENGIVMPPLDKIAGGGKICSLGDNTSKEWESFASVGKIRFQYRTINNNTISAGTDSFDIVKCNISDTSEIDFSETCKEVNSEKLDDFICISLENRDIGFSGDEKEYNKPQYIDKNGERTEEGKKLFLEESAKLTSNREMEDILRITNSIAGKCKLQGGVIKSPDNMKDGGGFICSIKEIDSKYNKWEPLTQIEDVGYNLQYRTINQKIISAGTELQDLVKCEIDTQKCEVL
jgi:hypothetical protein